MPKRKKAEELSKSVSDEIEELEGKEGDIERKRDDLYVRRARQRTRNKAQRIILLIENESKYNGRK